MESIFVALIAAVSIVACGTDSARPSSDDCNVAYEQLKVLQPLIGTWRMMFVDEDGDTREWLTTIAWSSTRKMIIGRGTTRIADASDLESGQPWQQMGYAFYVWNAAAQRIELYNIGTTWGSVVVSEVQPRKGGVIVHTRIRGTGLPSWDRIDTVSYSKWKTSLIRCRSDDGKPLEDIVWTLERVEEESDLP